MSTESSKRSSVLSTLGTLSAVSLAVIALVGRRSYKRKITYLAKQMAEETKSDALPRLNRQPHRVWAVLTPGETLKVFFVPMAFVVSGVVSVGVLMKKWYGIRDGHHAIATMKWIAGTGPPPS